MHRAVATTLTFVFFVPLLVTARAGASPAAASPALAAFVTQDISLDQAHAVVAAGIAAAEEQGTLVDIAVVDFGGNLKAFAHMDGAWPESIDLAIAKALTARRIEAPSEEVEDRAQPSSALYGIAAADSRLITSPGGLPLLNADGAVIGAIGVSGSTVEIDRIVAESGAAVVATTSTPLHTTATGASTSKPQPDILDLKSGGGGAAGGIVGSRNRDTGEEIPS